MQKTDEMSNEQLGNIESAEQSIRSEIEELYEEAREIADESWALTEEAKETMEIGDWAKYRLRVRRRANTVSIEWHRVRFVGPSGKRRPLSKYVPRGKGHKYSMNSFRDAPEWERDAIERFEKELEPIRKQVEWLVKSLKFLRVYSTEKEKLASD